jgi:polyvinyl alcohol dehydrogenase (cytochrome)
MNREVVAIVSCLAVALLNAAAAGARHSEDPQPEASSSLQVVTPEATSPEGAALYASRCAACHDHASGRVPPKVLISVTRAAEDVIDTLTLGVMRTQAAGLSPAQIRSLAIYITGKQPQPRASPDANLCRASGVPVLSAGDWRSWGRDLASWRFQSDPGFSAAQVPQLKLRWTFAYPGRAAFNQPAVAGDLVLTGGTGGRVFALDARTGCTHWSYDARALVRTGIVIDEIPATRSPDHPTRLAAWFGDDKGTLHAIDLKDGKRLWTVRIDEHPIARLVGTPQLYAGVLYAPVSSFEEVAAADPKYPCCSFRGSLVALEAATGRQLWRAYTVRTPAAAVISASGQKLMGPAGGSIFSAPTIDPKRGLIYVGTGDSYTNVVSDSTNAILALRLTDGARVWTRQVSKNDAWILLCTGKPVGNCPSPLGPDFDFASSPMLITAGERQMLIAGAKSGIVYGLDALDQGKLLWQRALATGTPNGAILWAPATDGERAYIATSEYDPVAKRGPGALVALEPATGAVLWRTPTPPSPCAWGTENCAHALLAGVAVIPGIVFAGAMDGYMRAYDARNGHIVWQFDTGQTFDAVNGVRAHGGAIDYGGEVIAHGMLFVNSGSMRQPGNVLLAFSPQGP